MKQFRIVWGSVITLLLFSQVFPRVIVTPGMRLRASERIEARAGVLMSLEMDERQRKTWLTRDHTIMKKYGVDKSAPQLFRDVEAYLNLTTRTATRLADTEVKEMIRGGKSAFEYGSSLIAAAEQFSDRIDIKGRPSVSQRRMESLESLLKDDASRTPAKAEQIQLVQEVHKKADAIFRRDETLQSFENQFIQNLSAQYKTAVTGIENEIAFQMFDALLTPQPGDERTLRQVLGANSFLERFETKYGSDTWKLFPHDDLDRAYFDWAEVIGSSDQSGKHIMLLASFAMERVKQNVKNETVWVQSKDALDAKAAEAVVILKEAGIELDDGMLARPGYIAKQCSRHQQNVPGLSLLHAEIQALMTAYDVMVRSQADVRAVSALQQDYAELSLDDQEIITAEIPQLALLPEDDFILESTKSRSMLMKWLPPVIALGIGVAWHLLGKKAHDKAQGVDRLNTFWSFFNEVGTPAEFASSRLQSVKQKWTQYRAGRAPAMRAKLHPIAQKPSFQPPIAEAGSQAMAPIVVRQVPPVAPVKMNKAKSILRKPGVVKRIRSLAQQKPSAMDKARKIFQQRGVADEVRSLAPKPSPQPSAAEAGGPAVTPVVVPQVPSVTPVKMSKAKSLLRKPGVVKRIRSLAQPKPSAMDKARKIFQQRGVADEVRSLAKPSHQPSAAEAGGPAVTPAVVPQIPSVTPLNQEEKDPQSPALPAPEKALSVATEPEDGAFDEDPFDPAGAEKPRVLAARYPGPLMATPMPPKPLPNRELKKDPSGEVVTKPGAGSTKVTAEKHRRRRDLFDEMQRMKRMATQVPTRKGVSSLRKVAHLPRLTGPMQAVRV